MSYHTDLFPTGISYNSIGGPMFNTRVVELGNRSENRNAQWAYPRERWNVGYGVVTKANMLDLLAFFFARQGRLHSFPFQAPDDNSATGTYFGTAISGETDYQLYKRYTSGSTNYDRKITKPLSSGFVAYDGGVPVGGATVNTSTGIVTFPAPPSGTLTADFSFYIPCRFESDHLQVNMESFEARATDVYIVEVDE